MAVILAALGIWLYRSSKDSSPSTNPQKEQISLHFEAEKGNASLLFDEIPEPGLVAISLHLIFDPKMLRVESTKIGNLWTSTNLLQNVINNKKGEIVLSFGKGFGAEGTGKMNLANFYFTFLGNADQETPLTLIDGSEASFIGKSESLEVFAPPLLYAE